MLDVTGMLDVDLFSLDVEGAELAVLHTLDFSVVNFRVLIVELDGMAPEKDQAVRDLLAAKGYEKAAGSPRDACTPGADCASNEAFVNPRFTEVKRARVAAAESAASPAGFSPHFPVHKYKQGTAVRC